MSVIEEAPLAVDGFDYINENIKCIREHIRDAFKNYHSYSYVTKKINKGIHIEVYTNIQEILIKDMKAKIEELENIKEMISSRLIFNEEDATRMLIVWKETHEEFCKKRQTLGIKLV